MNNTQSMKAEFTCFDVSSQWVEGVVGDYKFKAQLFDIDSEFGIKKGRVLKLIILNEKKHSKEKHVDDTILHYDWKWLISPNQGTRQYFDAVMELLENSPKRFS